MTFEETIAALRSLAAEGDPVTAAVWGLDAEAAPLMEQWGILRPLGSEGDDEDRQAVEAFAGEAATSFAVGDDGRRSFVLWPSRFRSASADALNGINIVTADGQLRVYKNRPWID